MPGIQCKTIICGPKRLEAAATDFEVAATDPELTGPEVAFLRAMAQSFSTMAKSLQTLIDKTEATASLAEAIENFGVGVELHCRDLAVDIIQKIEARSSTTRGRREQRSTPTPR